jgi:hypothetical protein
MVPKPSSAPSKVVRGTKIRIDAINSITPEPIRPIGSAHIAGKISA